MDYQATQPDSELCGDSHVPKHRKRIRDRTLKSKEPKQCRSCSGFFTPTTARRAFCSAECAAAGVPVVLPSCKRCAAEFKPKAKSRTTFCSRDCAYAWVQENKQEKPPFSPCHFNTCDICDAKWAAASAARHCSVACGKRANALVSRERSLRLHKQDGAVVRCDECHADFCPMYGASHAVLCIPCKKSRERAARSTKNLLREARLKAAHVEHVDPIRVFDRDAWTCQICGLATPRAKRGSYEPDAPELDHIYPLSKGGSHSYANTQCACRKCNGIKSDTTPKTHRGAKLFSGNIRRTVVGLKFNANPQNDDQTNPI